MLITNRVIEYHSAPYGKIANIPCGVSVIPATNLPESGKYWACEWPNMSDEKKSWMTSYGFLIDSSDVIESPFCLGQRIKIKPNKNLPKIRSNKGFRYGIIQGITLHGGMHYMDKDRVSEKNELSFMVASWQSPNAGAMWYSIDGLIPMGRI